MNSRLAALAVVGNISRDTAVHPHGRRTSLGGAALHIALAAARAGLPSIPVSLIGADLDHIRGDPRFDGIDWSATTTRAGKSTMFTLTYDDAGELAHLEAEYGVAANLTDHALSYIHKGLTHTCHVCCRRPLDIATVLNALIHHGYPFSIDFMVSSAQHSIATAKHLMHHADPVFVNATEYALLTAVAVETLPTVIVTDGPLPVRLYQHGQLVASVTPPPTTVVEVTGAGDTLTGTFLAIRATGRSAPDALRLAATAAARHITTPGLPIEMP
jgi:sugar/nucleoside kinase (ribokinase family)